MFELKILVTGLDPVIFALEALGSNQLPNLAKSVETATVLVQRRWIDNTKGAFKRSKGTYLAAIKKGAEYPYENDIYRGAVINNAPHARWIEYGTPAHDMKRMLFTSNKVRISEKGKRYLIIPFRHGTTSAGSHEGGIGESRATLQTMPKSVYAIAKAKTLSRSYWTGSHKVHNPATGQSVIRHSYVWGGKLTQQDLSAVGIGGLNRRPHWKSSPYAGMVRFPRDDTTNQGKYITFRVMSEDSKGWHHPGTPPMKLAEKTANQMRPVVENILKMGYMKDCQELGLSV